MTAYTGFLQPLLLMGLLGAVVRHYYELKDSPERFRTYFSTCFYFLVGVNVVTIGTLVLFGPQLWSRATSGAVPFFPYVPIMLGTVFFSNVGMLFQWLNKARMEALRCTAFDLGGFLVATLLGLLLVVIYKWGAIGVLTGNLVAVALTGILLSVTGRALFTSRFSTAYLSRAFHFGLPSVPHLLAGWAVTLADRVLIEKYHGLTAVGLYSLAFNLAVVVNMVITSINEALTPKFYDLMNRGSKEVDQKVLAFTATWFFIIGIVTCGFTLFGNDVVVLLTPERFHDAGRFVGPLSVGFFFHGIYFLSVQPLFYAKRTKLIATITVTSACATLFMNWFAIPRFGVMAAAYVSLTGNALTGLACYYFSNRERHFPYPIRIYSLVACLLLLVMVVEAGIGQRLGSVLFDLATMFFFIVITWFILRKNMPTINLLSLFKKA